MAYRSFARVATLALVFATASPAWAQSPEAQLSPREQAEKLIDEGVELRVKGDEQAALERFKAAYKVAPSARALGQMGLAAKSLRLFVDAEEYLSLALATTDDAWVNENRAALELARSVIVKNLSSLAVECDQPGAELYVNGDKVGVLPLERPLRVLAGRARVEVRKPGYRSEPQQQTLVAGQLVRMNFQLEAESAPDTPARTTPARVPREKPTPHDPGVVKQPDSGRRALIYTAAGVGLVGVGLGSYFGLSALSKKSDRDDRCPQAGCSDQTGVDLDSEARRDALISTIGFGVGLAGLTAAGVLWFTEPDRETGFSVSLGPAHARASVRIPWL